MFPCGLSLSRRLDSQKPGKGWVVFSGRRVSRCAKVPNHIGSLLHLSDDGRAGVYPTAPAGLSARRTGRRNGAISVQRPRVQGPKDQGSDVEGLGEGRCPACGHRQRCPDL